MLPEARFAPLLEFLHAQVPAVFPAAAVLVAWRGQTVFHAAVGWLDHSVHSLPAEVSTRFDLASLTKLFTSAAFMRLVDAGQVTLDAPVSATLPEFSGRRVVGPGEDPLRKLATPADPRYAGQPVDLAQITFRHLLTHTAGLAPWRSIYAVAGNPGPVPFPYTVSPALRSQRISAVAAYDFAAPPGRHILYSDLGFILLGEAVARLYGQDLETSLRALVFEPLGLVSVVYNPLEKGLSPQSLAPTEICTWRGRRLLGEVDDENAAGLGGVAGHAGLFATVQDLARLGQACRPGTPFLQPATLAEMTRPQVELDGLRRGLGWLLWTPTDCSCGSGFSPQSFGHTGFTGTSLWIDPQRDLLVATLTNRVYHGRQYPTSILAFRPALHDRIIQLIDSQ